MLAGPNTAFVLLIFGLLAIYAEFIWIGRVLPGIAGAAAVVTGSYFLFRPPLDTAGLVLLGFGVLSFILEACCGPYLVFGALGVVAVTAGFSLVLPAPHRLAPALAIPLSAVFGLLSALLAAAAKRARRNKWSDLERPK